jgi:hypothetical protein
MGLFDRRRQFPEWKAFSRPCFEESERLGLGPGDGISVRLAGRELPMDLMNPRPDCFIVKDPDGTTHLHEWHEAVSYRKRIT